MLNLFNSVAGDEEQGLSLCEDCGICCDGTLFGSVSLEGADVVTARKHRLPIIEGPHGARLPHPCDARRDVLCGIYEERPETCREFTCSLRSDVDDDVTSYEEAKEIIEATRSVRDRVRESIGDAPWWTALKAVQDPNLLRDLERLESLVSEHFWNR